MPFMITTALKAAPPDAPVPPRMTAAIEVPTRSEGTMPTKVKTPTRANNRDHHNHRKRAR